MVFASWQPLVAQFKSIIGLTSKEKLTGSGQPAISNSVLSFEHAAEAIRMTTDRINCILMISLRIKE
jgi:hypothetical protein